MKKSSKTIKKFMVVGGIIFTIALSQFALVKNHSSEVDGKVVAGVLTGSRGSVGIDPPILH